MGLNHGLWLWYLNSINEIICHEFESWALIMELNHINKIALPLWGQRVYDPSPFHVKAQDLRRGEAGPRMYHGSQGRPKEMAEDELLLGMP